MSSGLRSKKVLIGSAVLALALGGGAYALMGKKAPEKPAASANAKKKDKAKEKKGPRLVSFAGRAFGSTYTVRALPASPEAAKALPNVVRNAVERAEQAFDATRPDSGVARVNQAKAKEKISLTPELAELLGVVENVGAATKGALDVTQGAFTRALSEGKILSAADAGKLKAKVGFSKLGFDAKSRTIEKSVDDLTLDVSALSPAFAVDQIAAALDEAKVESYQIALSGATRVKGQQAPKRPWVLAVFAPGDGHHQPLFGRITTTGPVSLGAFAEPNEPHPATEKTSKGDAEAPTPGKIASAAGDRRDAAPKDLLLDPRTGLAPEGTSLAPRAVAATSLEARAEALALRMLEPKDAIAIADEKGWAVVLFEKKSPEGFTSTQSKKFSELSFIAAPERRGPPNGMPGMQKKGGALEGKPASGATPAPAPAPAK